MHVYRYHSMITHAPLPLLTAQNKHTEKTYPSDSLEMTEAEAIDKADADGANEVPLDDLCPWSSDRATMAPIVLSTPPPMYPLP